MKKSNKANLLLRNKQIIPNNSFTEFLLYTTPNGKVKVEIFLHNENIWLTQARIAELEPDCVLTFRKLQKGETCFGWKSRF